eukprot:CAMPEP_0168576394 /NCGR_PEP_ID=MMETSP0413-20121227/20215_1 /TAXON_ID=136452 /ORGANISM="Filamoeba nolandi, Strain NC-AS-23-1" /LENGTH=866 /DNA_ID=CAMNT_0008610049 /DNA_START=313 /DNA_END=2913 /DNA_ORIENTATION=-
MAKKSITAIELAQMRPPHWDSGSIRALFLIATRPPPTLDDPNKWPKDFNDFLTKALVKDPKARPTAKELLQHPFTTKCPPFSVLAALVDECFLFEGSSERTIDPEHGTMPESENAQEEIIKYQLILRGEAREGCELLAECEYLQRLQQAQLSATGALSVSSESETTEKYPKYHWLRALTLDEEFLPIEGANKSSGTYKVQKDDIGCILKCILVFELDGQETTVSAVSDLVQPGKPAILSMTIEGGPYYTRLFTLNAVYVGGDEGQSIIQWYKVNPDEGNMQLMEGVTKKSYQPTVADIGHRLEVKYIPVRNDGVQGLPIFAVSKTVLKVVGRVLMYTMSGAPSCLHARQMLTAKSVPFVEIDLLKFPNRKEEMMKLSGGKVTVPQIFFNKLHIGGLKDLLKLESSAKLSSMLKDVIKNEPPDFPTVPTDDEIQAAMMSSGLSNLAPSASIGRARSQTVGGPRDDSSRYYSYYLKMRDVKRGLQVKVRGPITRRVKAFKGQEMIKWLKIEMKLPDYDANQVAARMYDLQFFAKLKEDTLGFQADGSLYRFHTDAHDGFMLNIDQLYQEKGKARRSALSVSQDLGKHMMAIVDKYAAYTGKGGLSFANVANAPEYAEFMGIAHELQKVSLTGLSQDELKSFFLNIYNTLVFHSQIVICMGILKLPNSSPSSQQGIVVEELTWGRLGYIIDNNKFSLHEILHCILRGNRKAPKRKGIKLFSKHDPRLVYSLQALDPRIHFALINGHRSSTPIAVFSSETIEADLKFVTENFLDAEVEVDKINKELILPRVIDIYFSDFGKSDAVVVKWMQENAGPNVKEDLNIVFSHKLNMKIKYSVYDWDLCSAIISQAEEPAENDTTSEESGSEEDD